MKLRHPKSLTFKLTFLYAIIFGIAFVAVFSITYLMVHRELIGLIDEDLLEDVLDCNTIYGEKGLRGLEEYMVQEAEDDGPQNKCFLIFDRGGELIFSTDLSPWGNVPLAFPKIDARNTPLFTTISVGKKSDVRARVMGFWLDGNFIEVAVPIELTDLMLQRIRKAFFLGAFFTMIFSVAVGVVMARKSLSKLRDIAGVARSIAESKDLSQRVPLKGTGDELDGLASTFNLMLNRLEAFVKELADMLDNAAHDFKTPLARIRAMAETSLSTQDVEHITGTLVEIMNESDRFLSILNAIMDISEARTGLLKLKVEPVSIKDLLEELENAFSGIAKRKGIRLEFSYPDHDRYVKADRSRLLQALLNILDNALKFTPGGGSVSIDTRADGESVFICVSDTGPGIKADALPRIFDRFYREDESRTDAGRGIGLSLAKALIEAQGGAIKVKSTEGEGTVFTVIIPRATRDGGL